MRSEGRTSGFFHPLKYTDVATCISVFRAHIPKSIYNWLQILLFPTLRISSHKLNIIHIARCCILQFPFCLGPLEPPVCWAVQIANLLERTKRRRKKSISTSQTCNYFLQVQWLYWHSLDLTSSMTEYCYQEEYLVSWHQDFADYP